MKDEATTFKKFTLSLYRILSLCFLWSKKNYGNKIAVINLSCVFSLFITLSRLLTELGF